MVLIAFLSMQWAAPHIHIAKHSDHDSVQYQIDEHKHYLTDRYIAVVDFFNQAKHTNIVQLDHDYSVRNRKNQQETSADVATNQYNSLVSFHLVNIKQPEDLNLKPSYFTRSTTHPRAPPRHS